METHSSILAWRIPWTREPGRLQSIGSQELDTTQRLERERERERDTYISQNFDQFSESLLKFLRGVQYSILPSWRNLFLEVLGRSSLDLVFLHIRGKAVFPGSSFSYNPVLGVQCLRAPCPQVSQERMKDSCDCSGAYVLKVIILTCLVERQSKRPLG